jgi:hypothetical protein
VDQLKVWKVTRARSIIRAVNALTGANSHMSKETVKRALTPEHMRHRLRAAQRNLVRWRICPNWLYRTIQVDSKTFWVSTCLSGRRVHGSDDGLPYC